MAMPAQRMSISRKHDPGYDSPYALALRRLRCGFRRPVLLGDFSQAIKQPCAQRSGPFTIP